MTRPSEVNEGINQALEVAGQGKARPRIGSLCVGNTGTSTSARVDVPENVSGIVMVETREAHNLEVAGSNLAPATKFPVAIADKKLEAIKLLREPYDVKVSVQMWKAEESK